MKILCMCNRIAVTFNVNHTVGPSMPEMDDPDHPPQRNEAEEASPMRARPDFDVKIAKGGQKMCFSCVFNDAPDLGPGQQGSEAEGKLKRRVAYFHLMS